MSGTSTVADDQGCSMPPIVRARIMHTVLAMMITLPLQEQISRINLEDEGAEAHIQSS